jgi:hypothetical protein
VDFDKINRWVTLVANIGVVAGIFFLAIELRQANLATRIAARDSASQGHIDFMGDTLDSTVLAVARQKAVTNEELTDLELGQLTQFHARRWRHYERVYYLYQYGVLSEQEWEGFKNGIMRAMNGPSGYWEISRSQWQSGKPLLSKQFVEYVDTEMQRAE